MSWEILAASNKACIFEGVSTEGFAFPCVEPCGGVSYMYRVHFLKDLFWLGTLNVN